MGVGGRGVVTLHVCEMFCGWHTIKSQLLQICKGILVSKWKLFWQGSSVSAIVVWLQVNT